MAKRDEVAKRRSTAKAPAAPAPAGSRRLRPQNGGRDEKEEAPTQNKKKLVAIVGGVSALSLVIAGVAIAGHSSKSASAAPPSAVPAAALVAAMPQPANQPMTPPPAMAAVANTFAANGAGMPGTMPATPGAPGAAVANVPLFGPTPMATLEPAPLGPPPTELAAAPGAAAPHAAAEERMDDEEPKSSAHDESFGDSDSKKDKDKSDKSAEAKAEEVKPWGDGKMHLPLVFRMKLDRPGTAISGKKEATGFSVVIPGRKVEGSGTSIEKRDDRIATVRTKNGPTGAHVTFVFRSKIPSYKVRLRKSYVEFFVSSPDGAK